MTSTTKPVVGVWTYLTATLDRTGNVMSIWVNGRQDSVGSAPFTTAWAASGPLIVGGERTNGQAVSGSLTGQIDQVSVWDRMLDQRERIKFAAGFDPVSLQITQSNTVNWRLDDLPLSTAAADTSGYNVPLQLRGTNPPTFIRPTIPDDGQSYVLNLDPVQAQYGTSSAQVIDPSGAFAVSAFVDLVDPTTTGTLVRAGTTSADEWAITYRYDAVNGQGNFVFGRSRTNTIGAARDEVVSASVPPTSNWLNVIALYDPNHVWQDGRITPALAIYVDEIASTPEWVASTGSWSDPNSTTDVGGGTAGTGSGFFNGQVSDVRIFAGDLTANQIAAIYLDPFTAA